MNLEELRCRKLELDATVMQLASQWRTCQGHLAEVNHWISVMEKAEEVNGASEECPLAPQEDLPVE